MTQNKSVRQHESASAGNEARAGERASAGNFVGVTSSLLTPLLQAAGQCSDESEIRDLCQRFCDTIQHDGWLLACSLPHLKLREDQIPHVSFSGYDSAWIAQYNSRGYFEHDPVVKRGLTAYRPFDWSEISDASPLAAELFVEAARHGICAGFSVPLRGPRAARGLINFSRAHLHTPPEPFKTEIEAAALYFGTLLMESVIRVADQVAADLSDVAASMSDQEVLLLSQLSAGTPAGMIAAQLQLTPGAMTKLLSRIQKKLKCSSTEQALARAAFLNLGV